MPDGRKQYNVSQISEIIGGKMIRLSNPDAIVSDILFDSRQLIHPDHTIFFALKSRKNDGHKYIRDLYSKGLRNFVVSASAEEWSDLTEANFIRVTNTLDSLQKLCSYHRSQFEYPVIGITGSNGKTVIKEWLVHLLGPQFNIVSNPKSYNSQIGVPISVWQMNSKNDLAIFEAGISLPDEMSKLQKIIQPGIGIFTNIGQAHDENFDSIDQKIKEKLHLFKKVKTLIYSGDHDKIDQLIKADPDINTKQLFTWGKDAGNDLVIHSADKQGSQTQITGRYNHTNIGINIPFTDDASVENAIHCWALMIFLELDQQLIEKQMKSLVPVAMRLELKEGINGCSVINDSYSLDIKSLSIALDFLKQQKQNPRKTVVLSDFKQSGRNKDELYLEVSGLLKNKGIDRLIGIGPTISEHQDKFNIKKEFYPYTDSFLENVKPDTFSNETILLKGARIFEFEKIGRFLQLKAHETVLEINLDALIHNLNYYRSRLDPHTGIMAMVKAFSYGSGSFEIANILQNQHIEYLAVAYADEGVELRKAGISSPIMVMNPDREGMGAIIQYGLEPEIYSIRTLKLLIDAIKEQNGVLKEPVNIHIKAETGMHRLGFEKADIPDLISLLKSHENIKIKSLFSHLAASEDPQHDDFTRLQIKRFREIGEMVREAFEYKILLHILNSAGIMRFPEAHFDMVRLGISLYGIASSVEDQKFLQNVSTLRSTISQIKHVPANETIGYKREGFAKSDMTIAIIPIGYADGLNRLLGNGNGKIFVNGQLASTIGNICMDMCMIDITGIDAEEGNEVIIFGNEYPITQLAEDMRTIPYEILTGLSQRVKRVYYQE